VKLADFLGTAITAHMAWRSRLMTAIQDRRTPDPAVVRSDCNCALGKWLYGEGKQHSQLKEYNALLECHKEFHKIAASVVDFINADRIDDAKASLETGAFRKQSRFAVEAIDDLRNVIAGKRKQKRQLFDKISISKKATFGIALVALVAIAAPGIMIFRIRPGAMDPQEVETLQMLAALGTAAIVVAMGRLAWWVYSSVTAPIAQLTQAMLMLERGDETAEAPTLKRRDEIGELAEAVQAFKAGFVEKKRVDAETVTLRASAETAREASAQAQLEAIVRERAIVAESIGAGLAKLAAKDLTYRMSSDIPEAYRKLQSDFNAAIAQLEEAMRSVTDSTSAIRAGTQEISTAADDLSQRTEQQAAGLEETAAALHEITATVEKSAEGANHARQVASVADTDAKKSAEVVRQAVSAMDGIAKSSQQISQIIGVIDEIAFQTNLLALNAGVEAARAGEAGRGFAVVASEVRALAQRSAGAAKEIKGLISASAAQVDQGVKLVAETGSSLERIETQVAEINGVIAEIASGAKEQATALAEVNAAISQMDQVTQQNATMVEQSTAATHSLTQETAQLSDLISRFQLGRTERDDSMRRELRKVAPHAFRQPPKGAPEETLGGAAQPVRTARKAKVANGASVASSNGDWTEF
jgi:methyl-accepting chemotaxis protein